MTLSELQVRVEEAHLQWINAVRYAADHPGDDQATIALNAAQDKYLRASDAYHEAYRAEEITIRMTR